MENAQSLVSNAVQLLNKEYQLLSGVSGDVGELRNDLSTMNALLRMQSEADEGAVDHFVREWMRQLRELSYDSEDSIDLYRLRIKSRANDAMLPWLKRLVWTLWPRRRLASEIRGLRARATAISERHARYYGINREALRGAASSAPSAMMAASELSAQSLGRADDPQVVAVEEQADTVAKRMKASVEKDQCLKVFFIVGSNDDDRARLAEEVCRRLAAEFPLQVTVKASQGIKPVLKHVLEQVVKPKQDKRKAIEDDLDVNHLAEQLEASLKDKSAKQRVPIFSDASQGIKPVLEQVVKPQKDKGKAIEGERPLGDNMDDLDVNHLAEQLVASLNDKRYLIVIDDVTTTEAWDAIRSKLPDNQKSSRIIVSTPTEAAINACGPSSSVIGDDDDIYRMKALRLRDERNVLVGVKEQASSLVKILKKEGDGLCKVFSIVGFGGLGKTTLAMEVCRQLEADFPVQAMVSVSQAFEPTRDLKPLLKRVLLQLVKPRADNEKGIKEEGNLPKMDDWSESQLAKELEDRLKQDKRHLIVIDDVWAVRAWEAIQSKLPNINLGGRVIVTTRLKNVAKACSTTSISEEYTYHIKHLELEDSRKLFLSRAFGSMDAKCPDDLKEAMESILKKCSGLPLAIVSIAGVLAGYTSFGSKGKWETICRSIGSQMESHPTLEGMSQILTLSYNHLPHELKACMMYLSIFPEDYAIRKDRLLLRWIAEGLVTEKRGLTMLEVAESYFDELLSRNMIFSVQGSLKWSEAHPFDYDGKLECCQVHDMLLEVMVSKSLEANFVSLVGGQYDGMSYDRIRRLSIHESIDSKFLQSEGRSDSPRKRRISDRRGSRRGSIEEMNVQHVRSLSMFQQLHGNTKLLDQLGNFTLLRVLDLEDCKGVENKHVRYSCQLYLLEFLSFKDTCISEVPRQINNLEHLRTLDVRGTELKGLPATVTELENLESLRFRGRSTVMWLLPEGLSRMKALRELGVAHLNHDNRKVAREMGELQQLQELTILVSSTRILNAEVFHMELAESLSKLYSLRSLHVGQRTDDATGDDATGSLKFLSLIQEPPRLLRHLSIAGSIGGRLPTWVGSLTYLVEVVLRYVRLCGDEPFGVLCKLPSLQSIKMEREHYTGRELVARTGHNSFPALINLAMRFYNTPQVYRFETGSMPKLEKLKLVFYTGCCSFVGLEHLTNLKEAHLTGHKANVTFNRAVKQLNAESGRREGSPQLQVIVNYW